MDDLRLVLLLVGVAVIGLIYFFGTRGQRSNRQRDAYRSDDDALGIGPADAVNPIDRARDQHAARNARKLVGLDEFDIDADADVVVVSREKLDALTVDEVVGDGPAVVRRQSPSEQGKESSSEGGVEVPSDDSLFAEGGVDAVDRSERDHPDEGSVYDGDDDVEPVVPGVPVTVKARRVEPEQLDLDGLSMSATAPEPVFGSSGEAGSDGGDHRGVDSVVDERDELGPEKGGSTSASSASPAASTDRDGNDQSLMVVLTVMARGKDPLVGSDLAAVFESEGLRAGSDYLYHHHEAGASKDGGPAFSVLNVVKPGVFDPERLSEISTPGIAMVMDAGAMEQPQSSFDQMLAIARRVADRLDARVCDHSRNPLTTQAINHLRETIAEQSRRNLLRS